MVLIGMAHAVPDSDSDSVIEEATISNPLQDNDFDELQLSVYPLSTSENYGVDLYVRTLQFVCEFFNLPFS